MTNALRQTKRFLKSPKGRALSIGAQWTLLAIATNINPRTGKASLGEEAMTQAVSKIAFQETLRQIRFLGRKIGWDEGQCRGMLAYMLELGHSLEEIYEGQKKFNQNNHDLSNHDLQLKAKMIVAKAESDPELRKRIDECRQAEQTVTLKYCQVGGMQ